MNLVKNYIPKFSDSDYLLMYHAIDFICRSKLTDDEFSEREKEYLYKIRYVLDSYIEGVPLD